MISIKATDALGYHLDYPLRFKRLRFVQGVNRVGYFDIEFDRVDYPVGLYQLDRRFEIYYTPRGRSPLLLFVGFMRAYQELSAAHSLFYDYRDEVNYVYVGGEGKDASRTVVSRSDTARINASLINRREGFTQLNNTSTAAKLNAVGDSYLYEHRPQVNFERDIGELTNFVYGVDYRLGDKVTVSSEVPDSMVISGPDLNDILKRRVIAYKTGSTQAAKTTQAADTMIYNYVNEQLVAATDTTRNLPTALGFVLSSAAGGGATVTHSATYGNLYSVCTAISDKAAETGERVHFGVEPVWDGARFVPRFRTAVGQWGQDKTALLFGTGGNTSFTADVMAVDITVDAAGNIELRSRIERQL